MPTPETVFKTERRGRIFLAARTVFVGSTARVRDRNAVRNLISQHPATFEPLQKSFGEEVVVSVTYSLLENGIFESELKAKQAFPKLYQPSPARNLQHDVSEQEAARSEAEALDEASRSDKDIHEDDQGSLSIGAAGFDTVDNAPTSNSSKPLSEPPSLFPMYLSYSSQHKLLNTVQRVLEDCCYDWAAKWTPDLLKEQRWTCSEAVELGTWIKFLPQLFAKINVASTTFQSVEALTQAFQATHQLRHAGVHRLPTSAKGIEGMLHNALSLATALQDQRRMIKLCNVLTDFKAAAQDMELHKNDLESQLDEELREIRVQREALDKREKEAKLNMLQQDHENTVSISSEFEQSITVLTSTDERVGNNAEPIKSKNVDSETSELGAENDETMAADPVLDANTIASIPRDTESSAAAISGTAEQSNENGSHTLPSEHNSNDLESQPLDEPIARPLESERRAAIDVNHASQNHDYFPSEGLQKAYLFGQGAQSPSLKPLTLNSSSLPHDANPFKHSMRSQSRFPPPFMPNITQQTFKRPHITRVLIQACKNMLR